MRLGGLLGCLFVLLYQATPLLSQTIGNITVGPADVSKLTTPCGPTVYCLPEKGDRWLVNNEYFLRWWNKYPTFLLGGLVDIKLYEATSPPNLIKEWPNVTNDQGFFSVKNYPPQFPIFPPDPTRPNTTIIRECYLVILAPGSDESIAGKSENFFIDDYSPPADSSGPTPAYAPNTTGANTATFSNKNPNSMESGVPPPDSGLTVGALIGITLGSVSLVTIVASILLFSFHRRKRNPARMVEIKDIRNLDHLPPATQFISRPVTSGTLRSESSESEMNSVAPLSSSTSSRRRSSLRLTVKDAQLLAHTYRTMLSNNSLNGEDLPQSNQRSLYSDELLRRELAAEGRGVKNVSTSPAIVVVSNDEMGSNSMAVDHSECEG